MPARALSSGSMQQQAWFCPLRQWRRTGVVYVGSHDSRVYALNSSTGELIWKYATGGAVDSSPAVADGVVYVGSADGYVYALNATTGAVLWMYPAGGQSSPAVADGVLYQYSGDQSTRLISLAACHPTNSARLSVPNPVLCRPTRSSSRSHR